MTGQEKKEDWPHQVRATREIDGFFGAGGKRLVCVIPTGGGKSRVGQKWTPDVVFCHTNELLRETRAKFPLCHSVTIQSENFPPGKRILLDECHHYKAELWGRVFERYQGALFLGLTATPERGDGKPLDMFQGLIVGAQYSELIRGGYIVPCQTIYPGEPTDGALSMDPVEAYFKHGDNIRGFIFCGTVPQSRDVSARLRARGVKAESVDSHDKKSRMALDAFRAGQVDILVSVNMISEGIDIPQAQLAMLASACNTEGQYLQKVGRVLRAFKGKTKARLIDLVGAVFSHGLPTQDRKYSLNGKAIQRSDTQSVTNCPKCGACYLPRPTCPRCGFAAPVRKREVKIKKTEMVHAVENRDKDTALRLLLQKRSAEGKHWYWVVAKYKEWFDCLPDLSQVTENEKDNELERLKLEAEERGYKKGYAYVRWNEIFGRR
jgi:superfamily II DNA or RNA helicase